jgi:hypothetical protein
MLHSSNDFFQHSLASYLGTYPQILTSPFISCQDPHHASSSPSPDHQLPISALTHSKYMGMDSRSKSCPSPTQRPHCPTILT